MRLLKSELLKVLGRPSFLCFIVVVFAVNALLLYTSSTGRVYTKDEYRHVQQAILELPENDRDAYIKDKYAMLTVMQQFYGMDGEALGEQSDQYMRELSLTLKEFQEYTALFATGEYLEFTKDLWTEYVLFSDLHKEIEAIESYPAYLQEVQDRARESGGFAIFTQPDGFTQRNSEKTAEAFRPLQDNNLNVVNSKAVNTAITFYTTDILVIIILFFAINMLITYEKENNLLNIIRPTYHGRRKLVSTKILVLLVLSIAISILFFCSNVVFSGLQYGFPDLNEKIQSVYGFYGCALNVSILQFLLLYLIAKIMTVFLVGLLLFLFSMISKSSVMVYVRAVITAGVSFALYMLIPPNSVLEFIKYVNILPFLQVTPVFQYYYNLNLFSIPVNLAFLFFAVTLVVVIVLAAVNTYIFSKKIYTQSYRTFQRTKKKKAPAIHTSILYHEAYKVFVTNKGALFIVLFAGLQIYMFTQSDVHLGADEYYYQQYMMYLEGPLTEEKLEYITSEQNRFEKMDIVLEEAWAEYANGSISDNQLMSLEQSMQAEMKTRNAFNRVQERLEYITETNESTGKEMWFLYEAGWEQLMGAGDEPYQTDMMQAVYLTIMMIAIFAPVCNMEFASNTINLISCYPNGHRKTLKIKFWIYVGVATIIFLLSYIPNFITIHSGYGLPGLGTLIYSIPSLRAFPVNMPLIVYIVLLFCIRYFTLIILLCIIFYVSAYTKSATVSVSVLSLLFTAPLLIGLLGIDSISYISLNIYLSGNMYLDLIQKNVFWMLLLLIPLGIGMLSYKKVSQYYSGLKK